MRRLLTLPIEVLLDAAGLPRLIARLTVRWPIRLKLLAGLGLLVVMVAILSSSGLYATYAYRSLVKSLSWRVNELPVAAELSRGVGQLRITLSELQGFRAAQFPHTESQRLPAQLLLGREQFRAQLAEIEQTVAAYRRQLENTVDPDPQIGDCQHEWATLAQIEAVLDQLHQDSLDSQWILDTQKIDGLDAQAARLQELSFQLPSHLHAKLCGFAEQVRGQYRTLIIATWIASVLAGVLFLVYVRLLFAWIIEPLRKLIAGSRRVAAGQFSYRIHLDTQDETAELAQALNDMTARFCQIRDDLDRQVQERTKQVVRAEQLASVGFLAAGVAHEINNPLASIAMCAESLESRMEELWQGGAQADAQQRAVVKRYLRMIQEEAFRCKAVTEKLLDFSRIGPVSRQTAELGQLVQDVIDMVRHIGKYQHKQIEFVRRGLLLASVNAREIKQVVLNLLINALDSLDEGGLVRVELSARQGMAELIVADNGCGMDQYVLQHVFEPFFTRRRAGQQGTGLGLSISYRIVADHGGSITAHSDGPGCGSTFRVVLPLAEEQNAYEHHCQAA